MRQSEKVLQGLSKNENFFPENSELTEQHHSLDKTHKSKAEELLSGRTMS